MSDYIIPYLAHTDTALSPSDYQDALFSQYAANLAGLARSFAEMVVKVRAEYGDWGTAARHPILALYMTQMAHLTGMVLDDTRYLAASNYCEARARQPAPDAHLELDYELRVSGGSDA
jgi:hypothetical protein